MKTNDSTTLYLKGMAGPIPAADVIRFEGDNNYTRVYVRGRAHPLVFGYPLGKMCARFSFVERVSKKLAVCSLPQVSGESTNQAVI